MHEAVSEGLDTAEERWYDCRRVGTSEGCEKLRLPVVVWGFSFKITFLEYHNFGYDLKIFVYKLSNFGLHPIFVFLKIVVRTFF